VELFLPEMSVPCQVKMSSVMKMSSFLISFVSVSFLCLQEIHVQESLET
jgi:hypothetical protein